MRWGVAARRRAGACIHALSSYIQLDDFFNEKNVKKKIVKFCLHSSYIHFDDFLTKTIEKQFVKFCLHSSFIHFDNLELENEVLRKNHE